MVSGKSEAEMFTTLDEESTHKAKNNAAHRFQIRFDFLFIAVSFE